MKKKIFFSYTENEPAENAKLIQTLKLHFSRLNSEAELYFNEQQFAMQADESKLMSMLQESDCKVHLLSVQYANEEKCMNQLNASVDDVNKAFPILLSSFYWDNNSPIEKIESRILPAKDKPLEMEPNINAALTQIVKEVAVKGLGLKKAGSDGRRYYFILALIVLVFGLTAAVWAYLMLGLTLALLALFMFLCIASIVMLRVWNPTSISLFKF